MVGHQVDVPSAIFGGDAEVRAARDELDEAVSAPGGVGGGEEEEEILHLFGGEALEREQMAVQFRIERGEIVELGRSTVAKLGEEKTGEREVHQNPLVHRLAEHRAQKFQFAEMLPPRAAFARGVRVQRSIRRLNEQTRLDRIERLLDERGEKIFEESAAVHARLLNAVFVEKPNANRPAERPGRPPARIRVAPRARVRLERRGTQLPKRVLEHASARHRDVMLRDEPEGFHRAPATRVFGAIASHLRGEPTHASVKRNERRPATKKLRRAGSTPPSFSLARRDHPAAHLGEERVHRRGVSFAAPAEEFRRVEEFGRDEPHASVAVVQLRERARQRARRGLVREHLRGFDVVPVRRRVRPQQTPQRVAKRRHQRGSLRRGKRSAQTREFLVVPGEEKRPVRGGERPEGLEPSRVRRRERVLG